MLIMPSRSLAACELRVPLLPVTVSFRVQDSLDHPFCQLVNRSGTIKQLHWCMFDELLLLEIGHALLEQLFLGVQTRLAGVVKTPHYYA